MQKTKIFFPNLDGLRFLCFLSVFFYHSFHTTNEVLLASPVYNFFAHGIFRNGNLGVNFFFVLSGFLITYLLIKEKENTKKIHVLYFWVRRVLRIWPLYFFCVLFGFVIFPNIKVLFGATPNETANLLNFLTFTSNFDLIRNGLPDSSVLGVLWSIAIEEQFYFFWPILLFLFNRKYYNYLFATIILASFVFRYFNDNYLIHEFHTFSCIADMAIGALGASLCSYKRFLNWIESASRIHIIAIYLIFIILFFFRQELLMQSHLIRVFEHSIIALFMLAIILEQNFSKNSFYKMSSFKQISKLGIVTYGLYCLHFIGILITLQLTNIFGINNHLWQVLLLETTIALVLTILIAKVSYKYFESFFLKLKNRFAFITK